VRAGTYRRADPAEQEGAENAGPGEAIPDRYMPVHRGSAREGCDEGGVDSADRGTDYQVRANPGLEQRPQHPDLMCAGIGTAAEHERGLAAALALLVPPS
jgi:hypothetical protein